MEISFDNSCRLARRTYMFQYRGVTFKLVQDNPRKWADHLLTIIPAPDSPEADQAFKVACEFASALGWEHGARVAVWESAHISWPDGCPLRRARPLIFTFPRIAFAGHIVGHDLFRLPHVQNDDQRKALALYREATAANSVYLQFLFYWQVMEVGPGADSGFVNRTWRRERQRLNLQPQEIREIEEKLALRGRSLGDYLLDDCRNAIAHIKRRPGKAKLDLDVRGVRDRLSQSTRIVREFAAHYIRTRLLLTEHVFLVRPQSGGVARFVDQRTLRGGGFKRAYPPPDPRHVAGLRRRRRKPWE
jgi:hypothetical protein